MDGMDDPRPLWQAIYDGIRQDIDNGTLKEGDPIPTESEIIALFQCSRAPARQAIKQLEYHGLVDGRFGSTRTVRRRLEKLRWDITGYEHPTLPLEDPDGGTDTWSEVLVARGMTPRQVVLVQGMTVPTRVAGLLQLSPGERVVRRRRIRYADATPVSVSDSWWSESDAQRTAVIGGIEIQPVLSESDVVVAGGVVAAMGITEVKFADSFESEQSSPEMDELLHLPLGGASILLWSRVAFDAEGRRVRVVEHHCAGNRVAIGLTHLVDQEVGG